MIIKNKYLIIGIAGLFLILFILGIYVGYKKAVHSTEAIIQAKDDTIRNFSYRIDTLTKFASEKSQLVITLKTAEKTHLIEKAELKKLNLKTLAENTNLKTEINILKDSIAHTGTVVIIQPCDTVEKPKPAILLPFTFGEKNQYYNISGGFNTQGKMNVALSVPMDLSVWTGIKKGTKVPTAIITTTNPYVKINEITSVKIDVPKPFYDKLWFRATTLGIAFVGGVFVAK